jgi:hypothetical protein
VVDVTGGGKALMSMSTLEEARDYVTIDGEPYELARDLDLTLRERGRMMTLQRRYMRVLSVDTDELGEGEVEAGEAALVELVGLLLPACPADVIRKMSTAQRLAVVNLFTAPQQAAAMAAMLAPMLRETGRPIGDGSSRTSPPVTEPPEAVEDRG